MPEKMTFPDFVRMVDGRYISVEAEKIDFVEAPTPAQAGAFLRQGFSANDFDKRLNLIRTSWLRELITERFLNLNGRNPVEIMKLLSNFPKSCEHEDPALRRKNIRDVLNIFIQVQQLEDKNLNAVVKHIDELGPYLQTLPPGRHQIIVENNHYTTCDINIGEDGTRKAIVLDAAACALMGPTLTELAKFCGSKANIYLPFHNAKMRNRIQNDNENCSNFAFDHAVQIARLPRVYEDFASLVQSNSAEDNQNDDFNRMNLLTLPPTLIWNAQSMNVVINPYLENLNHLSAEIANSYREILVQYMQTGVVDINGRNINASIEINVRDRMVEKVMPMVLSSHLQMTQQAAMRQFVAENRSTANSQNEEMENKDNNCHI